MYSKYIKRIMDFILSFVALAVLSPLLLVITVVTAFAMKGNPFFTQLRPGKDEEIFKLIKFRTMTCKTDENGNLLPDDKRLTGYGKFLRSTSLDELPELINVLKGDMSLVGPRPQLVRDMVFMTDEQRKRHIVRPGLSGLAQISGRNNITWEQKLQYDLTYIENGISFANDAVIVIQTCFKVLAKSDIVREGTESDVDFGDWLFLNGGVDKETYDAKKKEAELLLGVK